MEKRQPRKKMRCVLSFPRRKSAGGRGVSTTDRGHLRVTGLAAISRAVSQPGSEIM